jgi:Uncharacterized conserved protein, contains double-stranded beta-helix domain
MTAQLFPRGDRLPKEMFTGAAYMYPLENNELLNAGAVAFEAGARNNWHSHPVAQLLIVTDGEALYQEEGKPAVRLRPGQSVCTGENVVHWHGATSEKAMTHIAVTLNGPKGPVEWGRPVTEEEYRAAEEAAR